MSHLWNRMNEIFEELENLKGRKSPRERDPISNKFFQLLFKSSRAADIRLGILKLLIFL